MTQILKTFLYVATYSEFKSQPVSAFHPTSRVDFLLILSPTEFLLLNR